MIPVFKQWKKKKEYVLYCNANKKYILMEKNISENYFV